MIVRTAVIAGVALLLAAASFSISAAGVYRGKYPAAALALAPWDARASGGAALQVLLQPRPGSGAGPAGEQARSAYRLEPLSIEAVTAAGLSAAIRGDNARAAAIFTYAERLSRRNAGTQLWLIEDHVRRNDIDGALAHYNILLSTEPEARPALSAILINASSQPNIAQALNRLMLRHPIWRDDFLTRFGFFGRDAVALATVSRHVLDPAIPADREVLSHLLRRYLALNAYQQAWDAYHEAMGVVPGDRTQPLLRNGDFAQDDGLPPFDWTYPTDGALMPERRPRQGANSSFALYLPSGHDNDAETASQLTRLPVGAYALQATVGDDAPAEAGAALPLIRVSCIEGPGRELLAAEFPPGPSAGRRMEARFLVPANCPFQRVSIWVRGNLRVAPPSSPWITAISLRRL